MWLVAAAEGGSNLAIYGTPAGVAIVLSGIVFWLSRRFDRAEADYRQRLDAKEREIHELNQSLLSTTREVTPLMRYATRVLGEAVDELSYRRRREWERDR